MTQEKQEWLAARIVHLIGGCRATNNPGPTVELVPNTLNGELVRFQLNKYGAIYSNLETLGFGVIGVDFYSDVLEAEGSVPPNWRSYHRIKTKIWPVEDICQKWRNIANAAFQEKNGRLWDLGSRIAHQLRVCNWRLRDISEAYHNQLRAILQTNDFKVGMRFEDGFTWLIYLSLQSFLVDACILRDYLSEFAADYIYKNCIDLKTQRITSMGSLKKKVLNKVSDKDELTNKLQQETSTNGWITLLGNYRDLVVHSAPLANAEKNLFAICGEFNVSERGSLPIIQCPIPKNPAKISASRSNLDYS